MLDISENVTGNNNAIVNKIQGSYKKNENKTSIEESHTMEESSSILYKDVPDHQNAISQTSEACGEKSHVKTAIYDKEGNIEKFCYIPTHLYQTIIRDQPDTHSLTHPESMGNCNSVINDKAPHDPELTAIDKECKNLKDIENHGSTKQPGIKTSFQSQKLTKDVNIVSEDMLEQNDDTEHMADSEDVNNQVYLGRVNKDNSKGSKNILDKNIIAKSLTEENTPSQLKSHAEILENVCETKNKDDSKNKNTQKKCRKNNKNNKNRIAHITHEERLRINTEAKTNAAPKTNTDNLKENENDVEEASKIQPSAIKQTHEQNSVYDKGANIQQLCIIQIPLYQAHTGTDIQPELNTRLILPKASTGVLTGVSDQPVWKMENMFKCNKCDNKSFRDMLQLRGHNKTVHPEKKDFPCPIRGKSFDCEAYRNLHYYNQHIVINTNYYKSVTKQRAKTNDGDKPYNCTICGVSFRLYALLGYHIRMMHSEKKCDKRVGPGRPAKSFLSFHIKHGYQMNGMDIKPSCPEKYQCHICGKHLKCKSNWALHLEIHKNKKSHKCTLCNKTFNSATNLTQHMIGHKETNDFSCPVCKKYFKRKTVLKLHLKIHTGEKPYQCTYCKKAFSTKTELRNHTRNHTGEKPYKCEHCDYSSTTKGSLKIHIKYKHVIEKAYQCDSCDMKFSLKGGLNSHIKRVHTVKKPYKCEHCDYSYTTKRSLKVHIKYKHVIEKAYQCEHCDYSCFTKGRLKIHIKYKHVIEKAYQCDSCDMKFVENYGLSRHIKRVHTE